MSAAFPLHANQSRFITRDAFGRLCCFFEKTVGLLERHAGRFPGTIQAKPKKRGRGSHMKKRFMASVCLMLGLVLVLAACGGGNGSSGGGGDAGFIGIAMPTKSSERWVHDGNNMKAEFEKRGYRVDLQYAEDIVENQISQLEN